MLQTLKYSCVITSQHLYGKARLLMPLTFPQSASQLWYSTGSKEEKDNRNDESPGQLEDCMFGMSQNK
jgi:hypothetical protein